MRAALAAVPPAVALVLLLARVPAVRAAVLSLASGVLVALLAFPTPVGYVARAEWRILPTCVEVALILLGGVLLSEFMNSSGANQRLADWIGGTSSEPSRAVVLVALGVTPFAEAVTGFGVGVVVAVPLLRRLGLAPFRAAVVGLLGLVVVPWGALAPGTLVAAELTGVDLRQLGVLSALLSFPVFLLAGTAAVLAAVGPRRAVAALPELLTATMALGAGVWVVNATVSVALAGALGSLGSLVVTLLLVSAREGRRLRTGRHVWWSLAPYLCLVGFLLAARLVVAGLPGDEAAWAGVLTSPALWLLVTCALAPGILALAGGTVCASLATASRRWWPVAVTTVVFLVLGVLLTVTGMSDALASAAAGLGSGYVLLAPVVGALGGFLTGSNTGANAMFASSQAAAAEALGIRTASMVAVQNVTASLATMASIPRVALATSLASDTARAPRATARGSAGGTAEGTEPAASATGDDVADPGRVLRRVAVVDLAILAVIALIAAVALT